MTEMIHDLTMWNYLLTLIVCIYGAGLFGWWAKKAGNPSAVFLYVMSIFLAEGWAMGVAMQARWLHFYGATGGYADYVANSPLWAFRQLPTTIVLATLAIHMSWRAFNKNFHPKAHTGDLFFEQMKQHLEASEASRIVSEAAIIAAEIVALASKEAAEKVAVVAKLAAQDAKKTSDHLVDAIKGIKERKDRRDENA